MKRTIIEGGILALQSGPVLADLIIEGETIAAIVADAARLEADERIQAEGCYVFPGFIDSHTHFFEPKEPPVEGFKTGSAGAAAGGVTTVIEMPQGDVVASNDQVIRSKISLGEARSSVDFGLWGAVINQDMDDIDHLVSGGVSGLKAFMSDSSAKLSRVRDSTILEVLSRLSATDIPLAVHAENADMLSDNTKALREAGRTDPLAHLEARPPIVEIEAMNRAIFLAEQTGAHVYLCHCSTSDGLELAKNAKKRGVRLTVETCPQYLVLDQQQAVQLGPFGRCAPAIRPEDEVNKLWHYLVDGTIDVISSDHSGVSIEEKEAAGANIWDVPMGLSGIQTTFPIMFDEMFHKRDLGFKRFVEISSTNAAKTFGLFPRKGDLGVGADADIVIIDPDREWTIEGQHLLHRHKWSPYEGKRGRGQVLHTLVRGCSVYRFNDPVRHSGHGQFIPFGYGVGAAGE